MQSRSDVPWGPQRQPDGGAAMRVSDAERNEVAEELSKHYADGRLDAAEFKERLDQAMGAKTSSRSRRLADRSARPGHGRGACRRPSLAGDTRCF